jgi:hypothetical protein
VKLARMHRLAKAARRLRILRHQRHPTRLAIQAIDDADLPAKL